MADDKRTKFSNGYRRLRRPSLRWSGRSASGGRGDRTEREGSPTPKRVSLPPINEARPTHKSVQLIGFDPRWLRRGAISLLVILTVYSVGLWLFGVTGHFLFLILLAWLIAIAMEPFVRWFERRGLRRGLGTGITMFFGTLLTALMFVMLGGVFSAQLADLVADFPRIVAEIVTWVNETFGLQLDAATITNELNFDASTIASFATDFAGGIVGILGTALAVLFDFLTVLVFAYFLAADGPRMRRTIASWLPPAKQRVLITVWDISLAKTGGFVVSKVILSGISAVAHSIFFLVIDLPFWLPMGIFAGVAGQLIPTIGTYIGIIVPILIGSFQDPISAIWIIAFATVYQQVENYLLMPRISRATMDIHPAVALASVFIGAAIWGPIGALVGIPLAAAVIAVVDTYGRRYELVEEMQEGFEDGDEDGTGNQRAQTRGRCRR